MVVAFLAAWFAVGSAANAVSAFPQPCHAGQSASVHVHKAAAAPDMMQAEGVEHHHTDGDHSACPTGGMCCDAMCHAVLLVPDQDMITAVMHYASYSVHQARAPASLAAQSLDRPPRPLTL